MSATVRNPIRVLDDASIDRIAAGEVIERPASVVKELVENSLDAGASSIGVQIRDGGLTAIVVEDDGQGVPFRELPLAFERHATSKIVSAADILQVSSFGFRGEALASIASVSRCTMLSRSAGEEVGGMIRTAGGVIERREPAARNVGTTITVEDLFYNTPARRKYMKTPSAERKAVVGAITAIALAYPEIRWRLVCDGATVLDLLPAEALPERVRDLLGAQVGDHLAKVSLEEGGVAVRGLASRPTYTRPNRTQQYIYVNRRPVRSLSLMQAIQQAYREVVPPGRHPAVILFLDLPAPEVDVNVHPAKTEVRLMLERSVFALVRDALRQGLDLRGRPVPGEAGEAESAAAAASGREDFLRRHFSPSSGASGSAGRAPDGGQGDLFAAVPGPAPEQTPEAEIGEPAADAPLRSAPFWQLHRTYILTQIKGGLVIIDQHNSHERILYNEAQRALAEGEFAIPVQQLLFPVTLELTPRQVQVFQDCSDRLRGLGFIVQPFGGRSIIVQGIPSSLKNWEEGRLLLDILDDLGEADSAANTDSDELLASYACHGAIRAGALLTVPEMQNLVDKLFATDLPLSCPHGRPTLIEFSLPDLEKRFGRR